MRATRLEIQILSATLLPALLAGGAMAQSKKPASAVAPVLTKATATASAKAPAKGVHGAMGPVAPLPRVYAPTRPREVQPKFPWRRDIPTTIFWIGEQPGENNPVPNHASSWDPQWQLNYGGYDDPSKESRTWDFRPRSFTPGLNPFYVALPFNDVTNPEIAKLIPWYKKRKGEGARSVCQSMWVAVKFGNQTCFAQWEDCGPFTTDDSQYVFGGKPPLNKENGGAGLDVSPAVRDFLAMSSGARCDWRFCDPSEVPDGPWRRYGRNNTFLNKAQRDNAELQKRYAELVRRREEWLRKQALTQTVR